MRLRTPLQPGCSPNPSEHLDYNKRLKKLKKEKNDLQHRNAQVYVIQGVHFEK